MTEGKDTKYADGVKFTEVEYDPFADPPLESAFPTTEAQREVWLAAQMGTEASLAYNESASIEFRGALRRELLQLALQDLVDRHEALRATVSANGLEMCVAQQLLLEVPCTDLRALDERAQAAAVQRHIEEAATQPFDLVKGPLIRTSLLQLGELEYRLVITAHHLVCDGWSFGIMCEDLAALYSARCRGVQAVLPPALRFSAYASRERTNVTGADARRNEQFWLSKFAAGVPVLDLPADRPRPSRRRFESRRLDVRLPADLVAELKRFSGRAGASLFGGLLGAFGALLSRLSGQSDVVIGVPSAGQSAAEMESLVGHCVNLLPLRLAVAPAVRAIELVTSTQREMLDAFEHQEYTFGSLLKQLPIERDPSRLPLVNVMFNVDQSAGDDALDFDGLKVRISTNPRHFENFELFVNITPEGRELAIECQYNLSLFDEVTVRYWLDCYEQLLRSMVRDAERPVGRLEMLGAEQQQMLNAWNSTSAPFDRSARTYDLFERQAGLTPGAIAAAVIDARGEATLDYRQLSLRSRQVARALRRKGIGRGSLVGLCVARGLEMLACQLGILASGAAYVPLDPAFPPDRLAFMASDADLSLLITESALAQAIAWPREKSLWIDIDAIEAQPDPDGDISADAALDARAEDPAYVIYTSGSTGRPKGVVVPHGAVVNFLLSMAREPGLSPADTLVAVTTLSFDIAVLELLLPLTVGAKVVIASREQSGDAQALRSLLERSSATVMQATPGTWQMLMEAGWQPPPGFRGLVGGESLPVDLAAQLCGRLAALWNMYGPTETTVWSTCERVLSAEAGIRIGKPIANTQVRVLDENGQPCPVGVPGEIYIGGDGVTLGYLKRPELTAERFVADPDRPGARMYRTGDRGRWCHDGRLEHQGRLDFQVKLRGYRIELGEIETQICAYPQVHQCVATVVEVRPGDQRLVAYVVPRGTMPSPDALKAHMRAMLPEYMLPQHIVELGQIPRLPNGKVDRRALPHPLGTQTPQQTRALELPSTPTEHLVAASMESVLDRRPIGRDDGFFALGGHSLLAAQFGMRLGRELGLHIPLRTLFEVPTVRALAAWIDSHRAQGTARRIEIPRRADQTDSPLSLMQQRLWFLEQIQPGLPTYNTPSGHRLFGKIDEAAFERAFATMVERQTSLRTVFAVAPGGEPIARVLPNVTCRLFPAEDLSHLPVAEREQVLEQTLTQLALQPFDLLNGPLFRTRMFRLGEEEHVLFFMMHHAVWDGWSFDLFYQEMSALYPACVTRTEPRLAELPVTYGDFAAWQREWMSGNELTEQVTHWKQALEGGIDPIELPVDRPRPPVQSGQAGTLWLNLPSDVANGVRELGRRADATPFMVLLAIFSALLHRMSGRDDMIIGTPVRGRNLPELESIMGFFVNALPLRLREVPTGSVLQLVARTRDSVQEALKYPDVPFEHLVHALTLPRDESRFPLYQVSFSYQDGRARPVQWGNLRHQPNFVRLATIAEDLNVGFLEREDGLRGGITYNADIFDEASIAELRSRFEALVRSAVADPEQSVQALTATSADEQRRLAALNPAPTPYPSDLRVDALIARQSSLTPRSEAIVQPGHGALTYEELQSRVNRLARCLRSRGVGRGHLVGLCVRRSLDMVVSQLAVLAAGAAYVPLDPSYPADRLEYMAQDAGLSLLVTESQLIGALSWPREQSLVLDIDAMQIETHSDAPLSADATLDAGPQDPAYVIYTSGSTGKPKGVMVPHRAVVNFLFSVARTPGMGPNDVMLAVTTLSFDIAVLELLLPLSVGAQVVLASREDLLDGSALRGLVESTGATIMQATPSTWRMLIDAGWEGANTFKALIGGEGLPQDLATQLLARSGELWNMYGPTETTVWSTCWKVEQPENGISIGTPIANTTVRVLDENRQLCPIGVPGEIYIGGDGVTLGYLKRPELTAERFIADPFTPGARLYRTGDRGRWRHDGLLEHMGRLDFQVKVRGHRIELGEIESNLAGHSAVARTVVIVREDTPGDARLVAYIVSKGSMPDAQALREHLRASLPEYMVPQHFVPIDSIPLLPNGKIDRHALPRPLDSGSAPMSAEFVKPGNAAESAIAEIWQRLLGVQDVGVHDNFFNLGGHSLLAMKAVVEIKNRLGATVSVRRLIFETLGQIAASAQTEPTPATAAPATAAAATTEQAAPARRGWFDRVLGRKAS